MAFFACNRLDIAKLLLSEPPKLVNSDERGKSTVNLETIADQRCGAGNRLLGRPNPAKKCRLSIIFEQTDGFMAKFFLKFCAALGLACTQAQADGLAYKRILIGKIGMDRPYAEFEERLRAEFQRLDADEDAGITHSDVAAALNMQTAEARARYMQIWLRDDVNGDFNITAEELRQGVRFRTLSRGGRGALPFPEEVEASINERVAERLDIDTNSDGTVSIEELKVAANTRAVMIVTKDRPHSLPGAELDLNCDDSLSEDEFVSVFREVYQIADQDGDGQISRIEFSSGLRREIMDAFMPTGAQDCHEPQK
jgi:Ca2+-binding EF-hand superfamily protein